MTNKVECNWHGSVSLERHPRDGHKRWVLSKYLGVTLYPSSDNDMDISVDINPGFLTDGASIGRPMWTLIGCPFTGRYTPAAVIHDGLYASHAIGRKRADRVFYALMLDAGVARWRANAMYRAVRMFGKFAWDSHDSVENEALKEIVQIS